MILDSVIKKHRRTREVRNAWVDVKYFDFETASKWFNEYKEDLILGALCIKEDNDVFEEIIENGSYVRSLQGKEECDGVEYSDIGTPSIRYVFKNGNAGYIDCYIKGQFNTLAGKGIKLYTGSLINARPVRVFGNHYELHSGKGE